jgi:hypothetical protein
MTDGISLGKGKCTGRSRSGLALRVELANETRWIPNSMIHDDSEVFAPGNEGNVVVNGWWADKEGLSDSRQQARAK